MIGHLDRTAATSTVLRLAEEEIVAAQKRHPGQASVLKDTFRHLVPPPLLQNLDDTLYRAHCREILELVATGDDIREGTTAEVIAALAESSQAAPLTRTATLLYIELFDLVFPGRAKKLSSELGPMEPNAYERTQMREVEADLRRKLATDRGVEPKKSEVREPEPDYGQDESSTLSLPARPRLEVVAVREVALRYIGPALRAERIATPEQAARFARKCVKDDTKEHFIAVFLDGRHTPVGYAVVSVGTATASLVHPREVYQGAIQIGAAALLLLHNHPSGDPSPSSEDREVTKRLCDAGRLIGIPVLDHVVFTRQGAFLSLRDESPALFTS